MRRHVCAACAAPDRRPALSGISVPTLVIHGADDPVISPEASKEVAEAVPGAVCKEIKEMGHGIFRPKWTELVELIVQHIEKAMSV